MGDEMAKDRARIGALERAQQVGSGAATRGFDWGDYLGPLAKIYEELAELEQAIDEGQGQRRQADELGDLLFSVVNLARHLRIDAEGALQEAIDKFECRFARVEKQVRQRQSVINDIPMEELEALWQASKGDE